MLILFFAAEVSNMSAEPFSNRLLHEKSPYLLQHAHNPVDWYPWGRRSGKPGTRTDLFFDWENGGFYLYAKDGEQLISHPKERFDGAVPSGNSIAAAVLIQLERLTGEPKWQALVRKQFAFLAGFLQEVPAASCASLLALTEMLHPSPELICVTAGRRIPSELTEFLRSRRQRLFTLIKTQENQQTLAAAAPFTQNYTVPPEGTVYYLCKNGACSAPVTSLRELERLL